MIKYTGQIMETKQQITLSQYIKLHGYTRQEWCDTVNELCKNGIDGSYEDPFLLSLVISWLKNYKSILY